MKFKKFLEALHSSLAFRGLKHPQTDEIISFEKDENMYDTKIERVKDPNVIGKENLGKFPLLSKINDDVDMGGYRGDDKVPVWVGDENQIFLTDKDLNSYFITDEDMPLIKEFLAFMPYVFRFDKRDDDYIRRFQQAEILRK